MSTVAVASPDSFEDPAYKAAVEKAATDFAMSFIKNMDTDAQPGEDADNGNNQQTAPAKKTTSTKRKAGGAPKKAVVKKTKAAPTKTLKAKSVAKPRKAVTAAAAGAATTAVAKKTKKVAVRAQQPAAKFLIQPTAAQRVQGAKVNTQAAFLKEVLPAAKGESTEAYEQRASALIASVSRRIVAPKGAVYIGSLSAAQRAAFIYNKLRSKCLTAMRKKTWVWRAACIQHGFLCSKGQDNGNGEEDKVEFNCIPGRDSDGYKQVRETQRELMEKYKDVEVIPVDLCPKPFGAKVEYSEQYKTDVFAPDDRVVDAILEHIENEEKLKTFRRKTSIDTLVRRAINFHKKERKQLAEPIAA
jgi:hypothetical protein